VKFTRTFIEGCPPHILQKILLDLHAIENKPPDNVTQFPSSKVGLEREGWDIPPEAA
jgi:hypothetical protein